MRKRELQSHILTFLLIILPVLGLGCTKQELMDPLDLKSCPKLKGQVNLQESQIVWVSKIADGDTFTACIPSLHGSIKVRVLGIDCPESRVNAKCKADAKNGLRGCKEQIPLGKKASALAKDMLLGQAVTLESPNADGAFSLDYFGRWLAYVRLKNGADFGKILVSKGICENYHWKYPHPRGGDYSKT